MCVAIAAWIGYNWELRKTRKAGIVEIIGVAISVISLSGVEIFRLESYMLLVLSMAMVIPLLIGDKIGTIIAKNKREKEDLLYDPSLPPLPEKERETLKRDDDLYV